MPEPLRNDELVFQAVAGDTSALERLLMSCYAKLVRQLEPRIPAAYRALITVEDLLQQAFIQVFRDIRGFGPPTQGAFAAWLSTVCEHRLLDAIKFLDRQKRGARRGQRTVGTSTGGSILDFVDLLLDSRRSPSQSVARHEAVKAIQVKLAVLPVDQRQALIHRYLEGQSIEAIAQAMDRTPAAIRGLVHRGKEALRAELGAASKWLTRR